VRTNIVLDDKLIARAMKKAGVRTMRETIDIALREYVGKPDYDALLALAGSGVIDPAYDPKAADPVALFAQKPVAAYGATKPARRRAPRK
jgi:hypothetical protein